ncbi:MAG: tripartite tricarboxylate transporter substrate binding protein [Bacteroidota bacterium]
MLLRITILMTGLMMLLGVSCAPSSSSSNDYPTRPLTFLVPWAAGGGTDLSSRMLATSLEKKLGQPVTIVNRTGGGGVVGHLALAQARPDGYTIGAITGEITMMHWMGVTDLTSDNYTPLALTMNNPASITVRADAPWQNLDELLAAIKANPGKHQASGTSRGGIWDLARIGFLRAADLPETSMPWVPSQGAAPSLQELIAGGVDVVTAALAEVAPLMKAGQVRVLAVMSEERLAAFPDVPTLKEQGVDWSQGGWIGVGAPKDLPPAILAKLDSAIQLAIIDPEYIEAMDGAGFHRQVLDASAFPPFMQEMDVVNGEVMKAGGLAK